MCCQFCIVCASQHVLQDALVRGLQHAAVSLLACMWGGPMHICMPFFAVRNGAKTQLCYAEARDLGCIPEGYISIPGAFETAECHYAWHLQFALGDPMITV